MACWSQQKGAVSGFCPDDGVHVAIAQVGSGGDGVGLVAEVG